METGHAPGGQVFSWIKFTLAIFEEGHQVTILLNYFEFLQPVFATAIGHAPSRPCFLKDQISLTVFVQGHLATISAKLFSILTTDFRREDF